MKRLKANPKPRGNWREVTQTHQPAHPLGGGKLGDADQFCRIDRGGQGPLHAPGRPTIVPPGAYDLRQVYIACR